MEGLHLQFEAKIFIIQKWNTFCVGKTVFEMHIKIYIKA